MGWISTILETYRKGQQYDELFDDNKRLVKALDTSSIRVFELEQQVDMHEQASTITEQKTMELLAEIEELKKLKGRHESIFSYKKFIEEEITPQPKYYDFGSGKKRVHTIFSDSLKDEEIIRQFIVEDLKFDTTGISSADELVYKFSLKMSSVYPTKRYYASDEALYGKVELWAIAKQTIEKLRQGIDAYDCDDMMTLKHSCLYYLLKDSYPDERWRLRGFIVDMWGNLGGHALLGWVKSGPNDFVPIETTYMDTSQKFIWDGDYTIRSQLLYQIRYSFDDKNEYVKI